MGPAKVRGTDGSWRSADWYPQNEGPWLRRPELQAADLRRQWQRTLLERRVNNQGLRLDRPNTRPGLALRRRGTPNGSTSYSSEANGKKVESVIAPSSCTDSMSGAFSSYSAELRIDGETLRGCAYPGALGSEGGRATALSPKSNPACSRRRRSAVRPPSYSQ